MEEVITAERDTLPYRASMGSAVDDWVYDEGRMIRLSPKDSSILARVAQYGKLPKEEREVLVRKSSSREAREAGKIILGADPAKFSADVQAVAEVYREWARRNTQGGNRLSSRRRTGARTPVNTL